MKNLLFRVANKRLARIPENNTGLESMVILSHSKPFEYSTILKVFHSTSEKHNSKPWERSATLVKNISVSNQYLEHIRESHDPSLQIKTIEDELKGTMGKALGKAGEKVTTAIRCMQQEKRLSNQWLETHGVVENDASIVDSKRKEEITRIVARFNDYRIQAIQARWELMVHRQAIGFTVNNQKTLAEIFHIEDALSVPWNNPKGSCNLNASNIMAEQPSKKQFSDQLDWWQRIGRWR